MFAKVIRSGLVPALCAVGSTIGLNLLICGAAVADISSIVAHSIRGGVCFTEADIPCPNMAYHGNCRDQTTCTEITQGVFKCNNGTEGHYQKKDSVPGCEQLANGNFDWRDDKTEACYYTAPCQPMCVATTQGPRCDEFNPQTSNPGETVDAGKCKNIDSQCPPQS